MPSKNTTTDLLESLAVVVHEGFEDMRRGVTQVDARFEKVESEVREVRRGLFQLSAQLEEVKADLKLETAQVSDHEKRITRLEEKVA